MPNWVSVTDEEILDFVRASIQRKTGTILKIELGILPKEIVSAIEKITGFDLLGYTVTIRESEVRHIFKKHGNSGEYKRGQVPIIDYDFCCLKSILDTPDNLYPAPETKKKNVCSVTLEKDIQHRYICVFEIRTGKQTLTLLTLYKKRNAGF